MLIKKYEREKIIFLIWDELNQPFLMEKSSFFTVTGKTYYSLISEYTRDGGHLNERGRKIVAEQLLIFLTYHNKTNKP